MSEPTPNDAAFWNALYAQAEDGWELGQATPPLARWVREEGAALRGQRAIIVGCGRGHEARLFAEAGARVTAVDFADEAVRGTRERCAGLPVEVRQADLFTLAAAPERYDLWVEHTCFCAIDPARRAEYAEVAHATLRAGGRLVGLFYAHTRPGGPPFSTDDAELRRVFAAPRWRSQAHSTPPDSIERRRGDERLLVLARGD